MGRTWTVTDALRALLAAGVHAYARDATSLVDEHDGVIHVATDARPSAVRKTLARVEPGERLLVVAQRITPAMRALAATEPALLIAAPDSLLLQGQPGTPDPVSQDLPARGPIPYGRFAIARALLSSQDGLTQQEVAHLAGVTQQTASDALRQLGDAFVSQQRKRGGWRAKDRDALAREVMHTYPGAGGITTFWWAPEPLEEQYERIRNAAAGVLLSGDLAADRISAWRMPQHVTLYAHTPIDPSQLGFARGTEDDYSLSVTAPRDPTLWATSDAFGRDGIADPIVAAADVRSTGTTGDQDEAAEKLLRTLDEPNRSYSAFATKMRAEWNDDDHAMSAAVRASLKADLAGRRFEESRAAEPDQHS